MYGEQKLHEAYCSARKINLYDRISVMFLYASCYTGEGAGVPMNQSCKIGQDEKAGTYLGNTVCGIFGGCLRN